MSSFKIAIPKTIRKVEIGADLRKKSAQSDSNNAYEAGYEAGYKAGLWKAEAEANEQRAAFAQRMSGLMKSIEKVHADLMDLAGQHLPQLLLTALSRVLQNHRFTDEELVNEIQGLLKQLAQAQKVTIECFPSELENLKQQVESLGASLGSGQVGRSFGKKTLLYRKVSSFCKAI
jgi:flagellar biosynthesis/type III secretory pathway protein FliH